MDSWAWNVGAVTAALGAELDDEDGGGEVAVNCQVLGSNTFELTIWVDEEPGRRQTQEIASSVTEK